MEDIIVALQFESELVDYFEVTYQWHAMHIQESYVTGAVAVHGTTWFNNL